MPNDRIFGDLPAWQTAAAGLEEKRKKALQYLGEKYILSPSNAVTRIKTNWSCKTNLITFDEFLTLNKQVNEATSFSLEEMQLLSREEEYTAVHDSECSEYGIVMEYQD